MAAASASTSLPQYQNMHGTRSSQAHIACRWQRPAGGVLLRTTCRCHPRTETPVSAWWGLDYPARVGTHSKSVATTRWGCVGVNHTQFNCPYLNNSECPHARTPSRQHASTPARSRVRARTRARQHARATRPHVLQNAPARNEYWMFGALDGVQFPVVQRRGTGADVKGRLSSLAQFKPHLFKGWLL